jgi:hypothetical protein
MRAVVFAASASSFFAVAAGVRVRVRARLGAVPAYGVNNVGLRVPEPSDGMEHDAPAKPRDLGVRATQLNRCPDGGGGVRLQDRPCAPVETPVAAAVAATASTAAGRGDVIDISALPPRVAPGRNTSSSVFWPAEGVGANSATAAGIEQPSMLRSLRDGALKLGVFVVALYVLWRLARWLLAWLGERLPTTAEREPDARRYGRPAPRPRAVTRRPERRRGSRWRRSS